MFHVFLTCGSAVLVTMVIYSSRLFMTKTLNFRVVFLFLKGEDVAAVSIAGFGGSYRPTTSKTESVCTSSVHRAMPSPGGCSVYDIMKVNLLNTSL